MKKRNIIGLWTIMSLIILLSVTACRGQFNFKTSEKIIDDFIEAGGTTPTKTEAVVEGPTQTVDASTQAPAQATELPDGSSVTDDEKGDAIETSEYGPADDPVVDIEQVRVNYKEHGPTGPINIKFIFTDPGAANREEYQFQIQLYLDFDGSNQSLIEYEYRDGSESFSHTDGQSGVDLPIGVDWTFEERTIDGTPKGVFEVTLDEIPFLDEIYVLASHRSKADGARTRDEMVIFIDPAIISTE